MTPEELLAAAERVRLSVMGETPAEQFIRVMKDVETQMPRVPLTPGVPLTYGVGWPE